MLVQTAGVKPWWLEAADHHGEDFIFAVTLTSFMLAQSALGIFSAPLCLDCVMHANGSQWPATWQSCVRGLPEC